MTEGKEVGPYPYVKERRGGGELRPKDNQAFQLFACLCVSLFQCQMLCSAHRGEIQTRLAKYSLLENVLLFRRKMEILPLFGS